MSLPWPNYTREEWEEKLAALHVLGGPGSGNFGHAGRPGEVGGSAPSSTGPTLTPQQFRERLEAKGFKVQDLADIPDGVKNAARKAGQPMKPPSPMTEVAMQGIEQGLDDLAREAPDVIDQVQREVPLVLADYGEIDALATASMGPSGPFIFINSAPNVQADAAKRPPEPFFVGHDNAWDKSGDDYIREVYRGVIIHEIGHIVDFGTGDGMTHNLVASLMKAFPEADDNSNVISKFVYDNLSQYAALGGPHEAAAEVFASVVQGRKLPKELHQLGIQIAGLIGKKKAA